MAQGQHMYAINKIKAFEVFEKYFYFISFLLYFQYKQGVIISDRDLFSVFLFLSRTNFNIRIKQY